MKIQTITSQTMRTLLLLLLFVSGFAYAQPNILNPPPYEVCDDNTDGVAAFDLHSMDAVIINSHLGLVVTYYLTQVDAQNGVNSILQNPYYGSTQTIYVRVIDTANPSLPSYTTLSLVVNPKPIANQAPDMIQVNNTPIGTFDLTSQTPIILGNQSSLGYTVAYYHSYNDANNSMNPLPNTYSNPANPEIIYAKVTNTVTYCFNICTFYLVVNPFQINQPTAYVVCDDNNDGIACSFILSTKDSEISTQPGIQISYHLTLTDSNTGANPIPKDVAHCNINSPNNQYIYVRVWDPLAPNIASYTTLSLIVNPAPNFTFTNTNICSGSSAIITAVNNVSAGNYNYVWTVPAGSTNPGITSTFTTPIAGVYTVLITDVTSTCTITLTTTVTTISNTAPTFSFPTTFCEGSITALAQTSDNGIIGTWSPALAVGTTTYTFTPYVGQCSSNYTSTITVNALPTANQAPDLVVVDNPYDGFATFDLTSQNTLILGGQTGAYIVYYPTLADAQANTNPITNPAVYINTTNSQTIGVRVTNTSTGCYNITSFNLVVNDPNNVNIPDANFKAKLIALGVDTNSDGNIQYSEATAVTTEVDVTGLSIADLTGFEAFTNVPILRCTNNNLSSINLSNLPNLKTLECGFNSNLTSLNLSNLVALDTLRTFNTNLSSINVNNLTSLKHLDCSYNHISSLNVSNLTNLKILNCASNWLTTLDVTPLTPLETLNCSMNQLATINVLPLVNLKTLICSNNGIHTLSLSNLPNLEHLEYGNNQSTSLTFSNLPSMKYLDCSGNSIATLNASVLPLLESLDCSGNHLMSINVTGLIHLSYFTLALNQMTSINVSGLSSLNNFNCSSNQLTSLNVSGLNNLATLTASNNNIATTDLTNLPSLANVAFDYNQLTSLNLTGSNNVNSLYCNNNLLTNLNITSLVNLYWLDCHQNQLTAVNFNGLTNLANALCEHNLFTTLDFSGAPAFSNLGCGYNPNLTSINIKNGNPYINTNNLWVDIPNLAFVCADDAELPSVNQIFTQCSITNAVLNTYCSFVPGGNYNTITGQIKLDANNNGCDASDLPQSLIKVNINDGTNTGATFTDANGNYKFYTQAGSFDITPEIENPTWFSFSPTTATISFANVNNTTTIQNFCIVPNGSHQDLEIVIEPIDFARPGFYAQYKIVYRNKGNMIVSGSLNFNYNDALLDFTSATVTPSSQSTGVLNWDYTNLQPFESRSFYVTFYVNSPTATPPVNIGTVLNFSATINPVATDENPADNQSAFSQIVIGSYDPNTITCVEGDSLPIVAIGNYLHYGIRFENTGNYQAQNIVVKDVIDTTKYDINSIQLLTTSHPAYTRITGNVIEFIFENINLAASSGTPPVGGHGDVLFKIKSLNSLVAGDVVTKSANIYFDYNAPIDTNVAQTTYQSLSNSIHQLDSSIMIYPNPTSSFININCNSTIKSVELYDVQGRILETSLKNNSTAKLDISEKPMGIYFLKISTENGSKVEKIVKE